MADNTEVKNVSDNVNVPDGFDIMAGRELADGWAKKEKGNVIQGRLVGRFKMGEDRFFYQIKLDKETKAITGKGDDTSEVVLKKGQMVNVDESKAMEDLRKYSDNGGVYNVWIMYGEKAKLPDGGSFWPIVNGPRVQMVKSPPKVAANDIPF
jgi:hypothetical protein